ncbi:MAG TPA: immunoglobulin domain-containing protein, partial [Opitutaceae bacterium]
MNHTHAFNRIARWFHLPTGVLIALLQRSPVLQVAASAAATIFRAPAVDVLKATITAVAAFGAIDTVAGATTLTATTNSPLAATTGTSTSVAFGVLGTENPPQSWSVGGTLPPGMAFYSTVSGTSGAVTSGNINAGTLYLRGTPTTAGSYSVTMVAFEFSNGSGIASPSYSYTVNVTAGGGGATAPTITTQPTSQTVTAGANVTFTVVAAGTTPTYQWQKGGTNIAGATNASLMLNSVQASDAGNYTVVVSNSAGNVTSSIAALTVNAAQAAPVITQQPDSQTVGPGSSVTFTGAASGTGLTYKWQKGGVDIPGATATSLTLPNVQAGDAGNYTFTATNTEGIAISQIATLVVDTPKPGRLVNLSVRSQAGTGSQTLIAGFIISGAGTKPVMVRASGPTLSNFGVQNPLSNPALSLFLGQTVTAQNDNWVDAPNLDAILAANGNMEGTFTLNSKDSIILTPLAANGYTAQVSGPAGSSGVALVEVFDTDTVPPGDPAFAAQPRLTNISARSQVGTGANILIAGFIINGNVPKHIMIRASGATLASFGVHGVLADPMLKVYSGQTMIAQNDNWGDAASVDAIRAANGNQEGPYPLDPHDSALVLTLAPGGYT